MAPPPGRHRRELDCAEQTLRTPLARANFMDVPAPKNLSLEVLKQIKAELKKTNARLDQTNVRLDATRTELSERIDLMREELSRRIVESELRTATAIADLAGTVRDMTAVLRSQADLKPRVERCEHEIAELKRRVG